MPITIIQPQALAQRLADNPDLELIDVRTPAEFREFHVVGATNLPLDRLDPQAIAGQYTCSAEQPLHVICRGGGRAQQACRSLEAAGFEHVVNIAGGTDDCVTAGLAVQRGKKAISLERQVRIAAGALVFAGSALGFAVHPYWIGLAGFVGAGLMFAGITDSCAMGMCIAKMPWNQVSEKPLKQCSIN